VAVSDVSIANGALSRIGAGRITAFTDDTAAGREVNARYAYVRDAELTRHRWRFSLARASLAASATAPTFGFTYAYELPADCLRLVSAGEAAPGVNLSELRDALDAQDYVLEGRRILTDYAAPLKIRYIRQVTDPTQFDAAFVEALSARLAYELATALADSTSRKEVAWGDYQAALREAIRSNALQVPADPLPDDSWLMARR